MTSSQPRACTTIQYLWQEADIYYRDTNGHFWQAQWGIGNQLWSQTDLGGSMAGDPTAYVYPDGSQDVYYRGTNGHLWQAQWGIGNQLWSWTDLGGS